MRTKTLGTLIVTLVSALAWLAVPAGTTTARAAAGDRIGPGGPLSPDGARRTGNGASRDGSGRTYVGYAAHCAGLGAATDTNGCQARSLPLGTNGRFAEGATVATAGTTLGHGTLAYSS